MKLKSAISYPICLFIFLAVIHAQSGVHQMSSSNPFDITQGQSANRRDEYRFMQQALGITKDGVRACFLTYKSSDGIMIFTRTETFRSDVEMETQFETKSKSFSEIIETSDAKDRQGNVKGERIVGRYFADEPEIIRYAIIRSHEDRILYIESISLNHILDFEKRFYKSQR